MKMSKYNHSILSVLHLLNSDETCHSHLYKNVHECMCRLRYRHTCHMSHDLNDTKTLFNYQAHQTLFPCISPPIYRQSNEWIWTDTYNNMNSSAKSSEVLPVVWYKLWGIYRIEGGTYTLFWLQFRMPSLTSCLNSKLLFISYFTVLSSPYISVYL